MATFTPPKIKRLEYGRPKAKSQADSWWEARLMPADAEVLRIVQAFMGAVKMASDHLPYAEIERMLRQGMPAGAYNAINAFEFTNDMEERLTYALVGVYINAARKDAEQLASLHLAKAETPLPPWAANFSLTNQYAVAAARNACGQLIRGITATALKAVQWYLTRTILDGIPPAQAASTIGVMVGLNMQQARRVLQIERDIMRLPESERALALRRLYAWEQHLLKQRGLLIARTEGIRAAALGQIAAWQAAAQQGLVNTDVYGKKWLARMDNRVCPLCAALNGTVVGLYGLFDGIMQGPPAHPNCRCALGLAKLSGKLPAWAQGLAVAPSKRTTGWTQEEFEKLMQVAQATQTALAKADWIPNPAWLRGQQAWREHEWKGGGDHDKDLGFVARNAVGEFGLRNPELGAEAARKATAEDPDDVDIDPDTPPQAIAEWSDAVQRRLAEMPRGTNVNDPAVIDQVRNDLARQYGIHYAVHPHTVTGKRTVKPQPADRAQHFADMGVASGMYDEHGFRHRVAPEGGDYINDRLRQFARATTKPTDPNDPRDMGEAVPDEVGRYITDSNHVNGPLRRGREPAKATAAMDVHTHSRITTEPLLLFRGIGPGQSTRAPEELRRWAQVLRDAEPGMIIDDPGFTSTSMWWDIGNAFTFSSDDDQDEEADAGDKGAGGFGVQIELPVGSHIGFGEPYEREVILPRNSRFLVVGSADNGDTVLRYMGTQKHPLPLPEEAFATRVAYVERTIDQALAEGRDTQAKYDLLEGQVGHYLPEREKMHQEIVQSILKATSAKHERKAVFMGGLPGAGKSTFLRSEAGRAIVGDTTDYLLIDPDEMKAHMAVRGMVPSPRELFLRDEGEASALIHEESSHISKMLATEAARSGMNVLFDLTMTNPDQVQRNSAALAKVGGKYDRTVIFIDSSREQSLRQAAKRYMNGGRYIRFPFLESVQTDAEGRSPNRQSFDRLRPEVERSILVRDGKVVDEQRTPLADIAMPPVGEPTTVGEWWSGSMSGDAAWHKAREARAIWTPPAYDLLDAPERVPYTELTPNDMIVTEGKGGGRSVAFVSAEGKYALVRNLTNGRLLEYPLTDQVLIMGRIAHLDSPLAAKTTEVDPNSEIGQAWARAIERVYAMYGDNAHLDELKLEFGKIGDDADRKGALLAQLTRTNEAPVGGHVETKSYPRIIFNAEALAAERDAEYHASNVELLHAYATETGYQYNSDGATAVEATLVHEIGHYVHLQAASVLPDADAARVVLETAAAESKDVAGWVQTYGSVLIDPVAVLFSLSQVGGDVELPSEYAGKNVLEFAAEAIADALVNPRADKLSVAIAEYMKSGLARRGEMMAQGYSVPMLSAVPTAQMSEAEAMKELRRFYEHMNPEKVLPASAYADYDQALQAVDELFAEQYLPSYSPETAATDSTGLVAFHDNSVAMHDELAKLHYAASDPVPVFYWPKSTKPHFFLDPDKVNQKDPHVQVAVTFVPAGSIYAKLQDGSVVSSELSDGVKLHHAWNNAAVAVGRPRLPWKTKGAAQARLKSYADQSEMPAPEPAPPVPAPAPKLSVPPPVPAPSAAQSAPIDWKAQPYAAEELRGLVNETDSSPEWADNFPSFTSSQEHLLDMFNNGLLPVWSAAAQTTDAVTNSEQFGEEMARVQGVLKNAGFAPWDAVPVFYRYDGDHGLGNNRYMLTPDASNWLPDSQIAVTLVPAATIYELAADGTVHSAYFADGTGAQFAWNPPGESGDLQELDDEFRAAIELRLPLTSKLGGIMSHATQQPDSGLGAAAAAHLQAAKATLKAAGAKSSWKQKPVDAQTASMKDAWDDVVDTYRAGSGPVYQTQFGADPSFPEYDQYTDYSPNDFIRRTLGPRPFKQSNALDRYTSFEYNMINQGFNNPKQAGPEYTKLARELAQLLEDTVTPDDIRVFRGSSPHWAHKVGERFKLGQFTSTSVSAQFTKNWAHAKRTYYAGLETLWVIDAPAGTHAVWGTVNNPDEYEVLLGPDQEAEVVDAVKLNETTAVMHVRILPNAASTAQAGAAQAKLAEPPKQAVGWHGAYVAPMAGDMLDSVPQQALESEQSAAAYALMVSGYINALVGSHVSTAVVDAVGPDRIAAMGTVRSFDGLPDPKTARLAADVVALDDWKVEMLANAALEKLTQEEADNVRENQLWSADAIKSWLKQNGHAEAAKKVAYDWIDHMLAGMPEQAAP